MSCSHNRPPPRQYSSHSAPSDILFAWLFRSGFYMLSVLIRIILKGKLQRIFAQTLFAFDVFMLFRLQKVRLSLENALRVVRCHSVWICLFLFHIVYDWRSLHTRSPTEGARLILWNSNRQSRWDCPFRHDTLVWASPSSPVSSSSGDRLCRPASVGRHQVCLLHRGRPPKSSWPPSCCWAQERPLISRPMCIMFIWWI
jgi:hypothetical protein